MVLVVVVVVVVEPVTGLRLVAVRRLVPPPRSLLLRLGWAEERVVRVVRGAAVVRWAREDVRGMLMSNQVTLSFLGSLMAVARKCVRLA